ncbi:putative endochitinase [Grifola frondosa]|uniref:Putative endochitinase n=1 Tax=Grifola frondosa TaxID=5627 RepID=A0A1C7M0Y9_GRIFR|nr:putative endochitinase [Grifola frondosa]
MAITTASIAKHTTTSVPRPHVLYVIRVTSTDGKSTEVPRRYSEFVQLHDTLRDSESLPPKRILVTSFIPSAWIDDQLIAERKAGLSAYLSNLLQLPQYRAHKALLEFLSPSFSTPAEFNLEDALPSTLDCPRRRLRPPHLLLPLTTQIGPQTPIPHRTSTSLNSTFSLFAFATPNSSSTLTAHNSGYGTKVVLSIGISLFPPATFTGAELLLIYAGGWDGSYWFSQAMSSSANRSTFVNACVSAVNTYSLDGIDIDWEYPGESGAGNPHSSSDAANLLSFFTSLRSALGTSKVISAAVTQLPLTGSNGQPLTNVSAYAAQMTYANIMNYDVWGASATPGPNAPLGNLCGTAQLPQYSAQAALAQWTAAGFPASKLVLGLPLYGYVSQSTATTLEQIAMPPPGFLLNEYKERVLGLPVRKDGVPGGLACPVPGKAKKDEGGAQPRGKAPAVHAERGGRPERQIPFNQIVALGALTKTSSGTYVQANGFTEGWDNCSDTPVCSILLVQVNVADLCYSQFLFDVARTTVVTYDDTYSLGDKALFAKQNGMAGCFTWSLDQASSRTCLLLKILLISGVCQDDGYTLQNVIRSSLGK